MSTPDPTEEIQITNSSKKPLSILVPTTSSESTDANGTMVFGESLEMLTSVDDVTAIAADTTETFVLDQTYTDPDTNDTDYSTIYDLLPSTADWLMPVASIGVMQSLDDPPSYPAQTVTDDDVAAFQNAATFIQTISAYPTSDLATKYQQAVNAASDSGSTAASSSSASGTSVAQSIDDTVSTFFQGTKTYQNVTLAAVVAIQSYYATFPFVWAEFATGTTTYYLYSSDGTATSFVGTIALTPPAALDITKANAGYTCTFTPASNGSDTSNVNVNTSNAKNLTYTDGLFLDGTDSDLPQVAVKGTFHIKSLFTNNSSDTQVITVLTGTINGSTCIGFDSPQLSTDPSSSFWDTLFNPKSSAQIFQSIMTIGGAVMLLVFTVQTLYGIYKWARNLGAEKQPTMKQLLDAIEAKANASTTATANSDFNKLSNGKSGAPATPDVATQTIAAEMENIATSQSATELTKAYKALADSLKDLAQYEEAMTTAQFKQFESQATQVRNALNELENASTPAELRTVVSQLSQKLPDAIEGTTTLMGNVGAAVGRAQRAAIEQNVSDATDADTELTDINNDTTTDDDPTADTIEPVE